MAQHIAITMTHGTNDPLKTALAILNAFTQRKLGNKVTMIMMGESSTVIDPEIMKTVNGFGLPPTEKFLSDECMNEVEWLV